MFDDIRWSEGMEQAWGELQTDSRFTMVADLNTIGVAISSDGQRPLQHRTPRIMMRV